MIEEQKDNQLQEIPEKTGESRDEKGRFVKGVSGNPDGKQKGSFSITALVRQELQKCPEGEDKKTYADLFIRKILDKAIIEGDVQMQKSIWAYMDGLPQQKIDVTSNGKSVKFNECTDEELERIAENGEQGTSET